jgi:hypothetical protein
MKTTGPQQPAAPRRSRTSWRLTFAYDGARVTLLRRERLQKVAPGTVGDVPVPGKHSGAWLTLLDRGGKVLFHRLLADPFQTRAEHHSPDGKIELHVRPPGKGQFSVVVPDLPGATEVALFSSPTVREKMLDPAAEVGRFSLVEPSPGGGDRSAEDPGQVGEGE